MRRRPPLCAAPLCREAQRFDRTASACFFRSARHGCAAGGFGAPLLRLQRLPSRERNGGLRRLESATVLHPSTRNYARLADKHLLEEESYQDHGFKGERLARNFEKGNRRWRLQHKQREEMRLRQQNPPPLHIPLHASPKRLSGLMGLSTVEILKMAIKLGHKPTSSDDPLPDDLVDIVAHEFFFMPVRKHEQQQSPDAKSTIAPKSRKGGHSQDLPPRPPVVTIMGHVNHGKTTLLDALGKSNIAEGEHGKITQHMSAFNVNVGDNSITFVDTPGHLAFSRMRSRGARLTDLILLVVAADEGVMPQTEEALEHARANGDVPMIVAITKMDKPGANPKRVKTQLLQRGVVLEDFGGDIQCMEISAQAGTNLDTLVDAILLQTDMLSLRADPNAPAESVIVDTHVDKGKGVAATVLVKEGTLKPNNWFVAGATWGKVRSMRSFASQSVAKAMPSHAVEITGFKTKIPPNAGDELIVVESEAKAKELAQTNELERKAQQKDEIVLNEQAPPPNKEQEGGEESGEESTAPQFTKKTLNVVVKADAQGSVQALQDLLSFPTDEVSVQIVRSGIGPVTAADVVFAKDAGAELYAFNVGTESHVAQLPIDQQVEVHTHNVIYEIYEDVKEKVEKLLPPVVHDKVVGSALVKVLFPINMKGGRVATIAGSVVTAGSVSSKLKARVMRTRSDGEREFVFEGPVTSIKHFKKSITEAKKGEECGIQLAGFDGFKDGDIIESLETEHLPRKLHAPAPKKQYF